MYNFLFLQSNTILSSASSLFTFLVSLAFLGERFTWVKLISVLLCMGGTVIVGLADSESGVNAIASNPVLGDILALVSSCFYAVYITLIRKKLPDEKRGEGQASMAEFLGYLGLFNLLIFLPVALLLNFTKIEPFRKLTWYQFGLIVGKGMDLSPTLVSTLLLYSFFQCLVDLCLCFFCIVVTICCLSCKRSIFIYYTISFIS